MTRKLLFKVRAKRLRIRHPIRLRFGGSSDADTDDRRSLRLDLDTIDERVLIDGEGLFRGAARR
jgi:hypothetical protein